MDIACVNADDNWIGIIQPGTDNSAGNSLTSCRVKIWANVANSTDVEIRRRADSGNVMIKIEMVVKSDAEKLDAIG